MKGKGVSVSYRITWGMKQCIAEGSVYSKRDVLNHLHFSQVLTPNHGNILSLRASFQVSGEQFMGLPNKATVLFAFVSKRLGRTHWLAAKDVTQAQ